MTTSFAWFSRGNVLASAYIQPMGTVLAALCAVGFCSALYIAATARPAHRLIHLVPARYYLTPLVVWALIAWIWKIYIHTHGIDGWR